MISCAGLRGPSAGSKQPDEKQQHDGADKGNQDCARQPPDGQRDAQRTEDPPSKNCADHTDDDVPDEAIPDAADNGAGKQSGDESDDEPGEEIQDDSRVVDEPPAVAARPISVS